MLFTTRVNTFYSQITGFIFSGDDKVGNWDENIIVQFVTNSQITLFIFFRDNKVQK